MVTRCGRSAWNAFIWVLPLNAACHLCVNDDTLFTLAGARRQETLPALSARALLERGMGLLQTITQAARGLPQPGPAPDPDVAVFLAHGGRQVASATLPRSEFRDLAGQPVHSGEPGMALPTVAPCAEQAARDCCCAMLKMHA